MTRRNVRNFSFLLPFAINIAHIEKKLRIFQAPRRVQITFPKVPIFLNRGAAHVLACLCIWRHLSAFFELFKENGLNLPIRRSQKPEQFSPDYSKRCKTTLGLNWLPQPDLSSTDTTRTTQKDLRWAKSKFGPPEHLYHKES